MICDFFVLCVINSLYLNYSYREIWDGRPIFHDKLDWKELPPSKKEGNYLYRLDSGSSEKPLHIFQISCMVIAIKLLDRETRQARGAHMIEFNFGRNDRGEHCPRPAEADTVDHIVHVPETGDLNAYDFKEAIAAFGPHTEAKVDEKSHGGRPFIYLRGPNGLASNVYYIFWIEERKEWIMITKSSVLEDVWGTIDSYSGPYGLGPETLALVERIADKKE
jgi:hypothetical protein